jgi:hypothetical protein
MLMILFIHGLIPIPGLPFKWHVQDLLVIPALIVLCALLEGLGLLLSRKRSRRRGDGSSDEAALLAGGVEDDKG